MLSHPPFYWEADNKPQLDLVADEEGADGFGGIPPSWHTVSLSTCCPSLQDITFALYVNRESGDDTKRSDAVLQWRYALRLLASAPSSLTSITVTMYLAGEVPYEELQYCTVDLVDWHRWNQVLGGFKNLQRLTFTRMDPDWKDCQYYEPYEPRGQLPQHFVKEMEAFIKESLLSLAGKDVIHFI